MKGWHYDYFRHSLAAKGIKTSFQASKQIPFAIPEGERKEKIRKILEAREEAGIVPQKADVIPMSKEEIAFAVEKIDDDLDYAEGHFHELDPEVEKKLFEARKLLEPLKREDVGQYAELKKRIDQIQHYRGRKYRIMSQAERDALSEKVSKLPREDISIGQLRALSESGIAASQGLRSPLRKMRKTEKIDVGEEATESDENEWN